MESVPQGARLPWLRLSDVAVTLQTIATATLRYGLALVIGWIGAMKFTAYEATGIEPFITNSPLLAWLYQLFSVQGAANLLGCVELTIATLLVLRPLSPQAALLGSALAVVMHLTTLTFLLSTPGWEPTLGGFPALSAMPGQFLLKDIVLLGAALWCMGDAAGATFSLVGSAGVSQANRHSARWSHERARSSDPT